MTSKQWKIRILSGVHSGGEVSLPPGSLVLGSDDYSADLVLSDAGVDPHHLTLECRDDYVTLSDCRIATVHGDHIDVIGQGINLERGSVVVVGVVHFAIGYVEDALITFEPAKGVSKHEPYFDGIAKPNWTRVLVIGVLCSVLPSAILAGVFYRQENNTINTITTEIEPVAQVRHVLKRLGFKDVSVEWNASDNQVVLKGYVADYQQKQQLLYDIDQLGINYISELRTMEEIQRSVRFVLHNLGFHQVNVENGEQTGTILLTGYIDDASHWSEVEQILATDVPGLVAWKTELQHSGAYLDTLKRLLEKQSLLQKVHIITNGDHVEIRGELSKQETARFYSVAREFRQQLGEIPYLVLKSMPNVSKGNRVDFPFRSVNFGHAPYVILNDDVRYMVGSRTPQGYRISSVTPQAIKLVKGGQVINVELNFRQENNHDKS
ncbi:type III secretion system inner membrane ring subunit SctD [Vibrio sp. NH-UV-68]|uniref:type III secretion system inner membrane ring subunit SctD n=1 Tax=unclassified Vibrio TaxID=2614977 RepID=UPI0036F1A83A